MYVDSFIIMHPAAVFRRLQDLAPDLKDGSEEWRPGAWEEVYRRSRVAVVKATQRIQLQNTHPSASLYIPRVAQNLIKLYTE